MKKSLFRVKKLPSLVPPMTQQGPQHGPHNMGIAAMTKEMGEHAKMMSAGYKPKKGGT